MRVLAPAKINLHLGVHTERDERGYHRVDSLMAAVDVCDVIDVERAEATRVTCEPGIDVPEENNDAHRAWAELSERVADVPPVDIRIEKRIPEQAGLGGGSSDAGAVLRALCVMCDLDVADERVQAAARAVGADTPFFLDPHPTLLAGAGDTAVRRLAHVGALWVVLARAEGAGVGTRAAYDWFDRLPVEPGDPSDLCDALEAGDARRAGELLSNNLEHVACALSPEVMDVLDELRACEDSLGAMVCGSGSACFALCETEGAAWSCLSQVSSRNPGWWARSARVWRS